MLVDISAAPQRHQALMKFPSVCSTTDIKLIMCTADALFLPTVANVFSSSSALVADRNRRWNLRLRLISSYRMWSANTETGQSRWVTAMEKGFS